MQINPGGRLNTKDVMGRDTDFIRSIYAAVEEFSRTSPGVRARFAKWSGLLPHKVGGVDLPTADSNWQVLLSGAFDDLIRVADDRCVLMLWDEFPLMLHNEIARYWDVLDRQGLVISAERRIGKTHIVLKMRDECRSGYLPILREPPVLVLPGR